MKLKTALTIAGSDCSGGAGIQADMKTMTMNGVYAMSAITALTAQNTTGVRAIQESTPDFLKQQMDAVGGADINNYSFIREKLCADDYVVFCDSGLKHLAYLQTKPGLIVGDFDSHENPNLDVETIVLPCEKDDTDTVFAVKEAIKRGYDDFLLIGVVGARLDHTLGNVSILLHLDSIGKKGCIIDDYSELEIVSKEPVFISDSYAFFSLLNITGCAKGITILEAKYPLENAEITCEYQYGISNEVLPGKTATVSVGNGKLLLIKVRS